MASRGTPLSNIDCGARGLSASVTEAGPAGEDHALGLKAVKSLLSSVERSDLGIDAGFADAPGDQLGNLAAEVDDEDGFRVGNRHGGRIGSIAAAVKVAGTSALVLGLQFEVFAASQLV